MYDFQFSSVAKYESSRRYRNVNPLRSNPADYCPLFPHINDAVAPPSCCWHRLPNGVSVPRRGRYIYRRKSRLAKSSKVSRESIAADAPPSRECRRINPVRCQRTTTRGINIAETNAERRLPQRRNRPHDGSIREHEIGLIRAIKRSRNVRGVENIDCGEDATRATTTRVVARASSRNISGACDRSRLRQFSHVMSARHNTRINNH